MLTEVTRAQQPRTPMFEYERWNVYHMAVELHARAMGLVPTQDGSVLRERLEWASLQAALCIAEVAFTSCPDEQLRLYETAHVCVADTAVVVDVLRIRKLADVEACSAVRAGAIRLARILAARRVRSVRRKAARIGVP